MSAMGLYTPQYVKYLPKLWDKVTDDNLGNEGALRRRPPQRRRPSRAFFASVVICHLHSQFRNILLNILLENFKFIKLKCKRNSMHVINIDLFWINFRFETNTMSLNCRRSILIPEKNKHFALERKNWLLS